MSASGLSTTRLDRVRQVLARHVERGAVPGAVALVSRRGETHVDAVGTMAFSSDDPMRRDTIFRISSMTKPITAAAAMLLVEACVVRLDDPVDRLLPELADRRVLTRIDGPLDDTAPAERPITVRDLLTFRMGFGVLVDSPEPHPILKASDDLKLGQGPPAPGEIPAPDEWIRRLGSLPLMRQPGVRWIYNTGSDVLGVLIARAAGQPFEDFLHDRVFEPLGMRDTAFSVPAAALDRLPTSYLSGVETGAAQPYDDPAGQWSRPPAFPSGAAGLVSTVDDYGAFASMLLSLGRHGETRFLSRPSVELMMTNQLTPEQQATAGPILGEHFGWGFGGAIVLTRSDISMTPGLYGWDGGLGTTFLVDRQEQLVAILLTQVSYPKFLEVSADFRTSVYQAIDD
jgi:CubicO group peptidase (beta-lactamase class C family)